MASNIQNRYSFSAASAYTSEAVLCDACYCVSIQAVGTSLSAADGTIKLQKSNDGTTFADVASATTVAANSTAYIVEDEVASCMWYRFVWAKGTNAAGTVVVSLAGKV